jgi:hypothetical protein
MRKVFALLTRARFLYELVRKNGFRMYPAGPRVGDMSSFAHVVICSPKLCVDQSKQSEQLRKLL